jgi:hypothetical protein
LAFIASPVFLYSIFISSLARQKVEGLVVIEIRRLNKYLRRLITVAFLLGLTVALVHFGYVDKSKVIAGFVMVATLLAFLILVFRIFIPIAGGWALRNIISDRDKDIFEKVAILRWLLS